MKTVIIIVLVIILLMVITAPNHFYALTTQVVEIDKVNDVVTVEDCNGNLWTFEGTEDWEIGDCASLIMVDNGTKTIEDDVIVSTEYSNWILTH